MKARTYDLLHLLLRETRDERRQEVRRCGHARAVHDRRDPCQRPAWQAPGSVHHLVQLQHHAADVRHRALAPVVFKMPFGYSVAAILLGNLAGSLFMALRSAQGPRLGVPQMIQSQGQFGMIGAVLVIAIAVFMYVGFFASNIILGGQLINALVPGISTDWGIVICAVGSMFITVFGYDMIHAVNRWATLLFGGAGMVGLTVCFDRDFPEVARAMRDAGARLVVQPSAYEAAARVWWRTLYPAHALSNGQWWVLANQCGTNPSGTLLGESQVISPPGDVLGKTRGAPDGETPPAELMIVPVPLTRELARAERDNGVLRSLVRTDLQVHGLER